MSSASTFTYGSNGWDSYGNCFGRYAQKTLQGSTLSDHCMTTGFGPDWDYAGGLFLECERLSSPVPSLRTPPETVWWTKSNFLGLFPKSGKDQWDWIITLHFPYNIKFFTSTQASIPILSGFGVLIVARLHCRKSVCQPKKIDLVHQTVSPHERMGCGDRFSTSIADSAFTLQVTTLELENLGVIIHTLLYLCSGAV